jgi:SAM-dependent methyltransferase
VRAGAHKVAEDFDRIARLTADDDEHPSPYDEFLLRQVPPSCRRVLDVGCGRGALARALAERGHEVTGVDLSPEMISVARERTPAARRVDYRCGDFMGDALGAETFDCVVSAAALHHMPLEAAVARMAELVRPGGVLVIHDVRSDAGVWDRLRSAPGLVERALARVRGGGRVAERAKLRAAWREHGRGERYLTMAEVEAWSRAHLPGARATRHRQWRYTVVWRKPGAA